LADSYGNRHVYAYANEQPVSLAALRQLGAKSRSIEATELIVTDSYHGGAEPRADETKQKSSAVVAPLLEAGETPVVTGFIGATHDGRLTTLGRGGSDYSATILGAALDADEIIIWTDVEGVLTADPRLVPDARTIPEISYREAAELAYFGAKVLHPKTIQPAMDRQIPVRVCNSRAPAEAGTLIVTESKAAPGFLPSLSSPHVSYSSYRQNCCPDDRHKQSDDYHDFLPGEKPGINDGEHASS